MWTGNEFVIDDSTTEADHSPSTFGRGAVPRNYGIHPTGFYSAAPAFDLPLIPRDQWVERIKEGHAKKAFVSYIRRAEGPNGGHIPSLDQNGVGYCWNHSITMCNMLLRAIAMQPYVKLSAFMVGCLVKNYKDEGGWGALALDFVAKNGQPSVAFWPEKSMKKSNDTPEMRANALLHRITESWADLNAAVYDRNLTEDQAMTLLMLGIPLVGDFNWWGHSVCLMDPMLDANRMTEIESIDLGSLDFNDHSQSKVFGDLFPKKGLNSWTDGWGDLGEFVLSGTKARLDGGVAPRSTAATKV